MIAYPHSFGKEVDFFLGLNPGSPYSSGTSMANSFLQQWGNLIDLAHVWLPEQLWHSNLPVNEPLLGCESACTQGQEPVHGPARGTLRGLAPSGSVLMPIAAQTPCAVRQHIPSLALVRR